MTTKDLEVISTQPASIESYADNLNQKLQMAQVLLKSGLLPNHYRTPEAVLTAILFGRELGFSPIKSLNSITVINGKPTLEAQALKSLAIAHGGKIKTVEWTDKVCSLECTRGDWTDSVTYTWEDASKAGLVGKDNWRRMPKPMLYARAVSTLVRNMFADVLGGLYSREEMQDSADAQIKEKTPVVLAQVSSTNDADDLPASWFIEAPQPTLEKQARDAIDGDDLKWLGDYVITTRCSFNGMAVRDAVAKDRKKLTGNLGKLNKLDREVVGAFLELVPTEDIVFEYAEEVENEG